MSILKKIFWIPLVIGGMALFFQNCGKQSFQSSLGDNSLASIDEPAPVINLSCHFDGDELADGQTVTAYQNSTVPAGSSCIYEQRHCEVGNLSGSYNYSSCEVSVPASCLFNGRTILSGNTVRAYVNANPAQGAACVDEVRTCIDGKLSGSYNFSSCTATPFAGCNLNGRNLAHNESIKAFLTSTTAAGVACSEEMRKCNNGTLSGSFAFSACTPGMFRSCTFNGKVIAHGESLDAYLNSTVAASATCTSEKRVCNDGMLTGSYNFSACSKNAFMMCNFNGANLAHGQSVRAYPTSTVPFGKTCMATVRDCFDGALSGSGNFATCNVDAPAMCSFNGRNYAHGEPAIAYAVSSVAFGQSCVPTTRTCNNGAMSGTGNFASCSVAAPANCNFNGTNIAHGQSFKSYTASHVAFGQTCSSLEVTRSCNNGSLTGSASATMASCSVDAAPSCSLPWGGTIASGQSVTAYARCEYGGGGDSDAKTTRVCNAGTLSKPSNSYGKPFKYRLCYYGDSHDNPGGGSLSPTTGSSCNCE